METLELTGQRFGRLIAIEATRKRKRRNIIWKCECDCGNIVEVMARNLKAGLSRSCGCLQKEIVGKLNRTHGHSTKITKTYRTWKNMLQRCGNPKNKSYNNYGGRGIKVCDRWLHSFENFLDDMGEAPERLTIERENNNGNYEPGNCVWTTRKEQNYNTRRNLTQLKVQVIKKLLKESSLMQKDVAEIFGVHRSTIYNIRIGRNVGKH